MMRTRVMYRLGIACVPPLVVLKRTASLRLPWVREFCSTMILAARGLVKATKADTRRKLAFWGMSEVDMLCLLVICRGG